MTGNATGGVRLALLGEVKMAAADGASVERILTQPKRFALLAFLTAGLPRGFHRRDELLALFWPKLDYEGASGSLRQALHFLRQSLPPGALQNRGAAEVRVAPEVVGCDVLRFEELLDSGREEEALAEYGGDLMPAFHLRGASGFEDWLEMERERLRRRAARAAAFLAGEAARPGMRAGASVQAAAAVLPKTPVTSRPAGPAASNGARRDPQTDLQASPDPSAYRAWVLGRHCSRQRSPASMLQAVEHYRNALRLDPCFAPAHVGLAEAWTVLPVYSAHPPADAYPRAKHHAARALALDDTLADAHGYFALATVCYEWDWYKAGREFKRALELGPASADVLVAYALYYLTPLGRFPEAIDVIEAARRSSPTSPAESAYVAMVCYHGREFERAVVEARLALELNEQFPLGWWTLGLAQEQLGQTAEAISAYEHAVDLTAESPLMLVQLGRAHARAGNTCEARAIADRLHGGLETHVPTPYFTASLYGALGETQPALDSLDRAYRERAPHLVFLKVAPEMDCLRGELRFRQLLARLGLNGQHPAA
jgi:tetratricopeptide (TPR) repeat protein